tara:strand:- start:249 stop:545 length:297 start_codon:yes stop_codon:yes gene_type:complete
MNNERFTSFLYEPPKPFHEMSLRELCDFNKITNLLDKMSLKKIKRIESWSDKKRKRKIKKFLKKKRKTVKHVRYLKNSSKKKTKKIHINKDILLLNRY